MFALSLGVWAALFFFTFAYLSIAWGKSEYPPMGKGINSCRAAIVFSLFSIGTWVRRIQLRTYFRTFVNCYSLF